MDREEMRKAFQDWANSSSLKTGYVRRVHDKSYYFNETTEKAWQAWQAAMAHSCEALTIERDALRRALEVIAVGDAKDPATDAADELVALGYWRAEAVAAMRRHGG